MADIDDEVPVLSSETLKALQEFYQENAKNAPTEDAESMPKEDWQLSQFWYDEATAISLAKEAVAAAGPGGKIACLSCPSLFKAMQSLTTTAVCLEYDTRFSAFGDDYLFYDYREPLNLPKEWKNKFDVVVADPPFLSDECLTKTAITIRFLAKDKIIVCTGSVMEELALKLLSVRPISFRPRHEHNLSNEFSCFTNYRPETLE